MKRITVWVAEIYDSEYPVPRKRAYLRTEADANKYLELNPAKHHARTFTLSGTLDRGTFCPDNQVPTWGQ